ncbi:hypothetical protein OAS48_01715 [Gammaproteobacteria bacterium]|jgi:hypothetical protein|nr:hypothetical protein [Gammaproteobacteria bacterium]|tara:strand:- start:692 stop:1225 length:534 start_codon:yes stop_codon:yes gene_type:complete
MKAILGVEVDGETIGAELGFMALENMIYSIPDTEENAAMFAALAKHPSPNIREGVANKQNIDSDTLMMLAEDKDPRVVAAVICTDAFKTFVSVEQIKSIIARGEERPIQNLLSFAGQFEEVSVEEIEQALKDADIQNPNILLEAAQSYDLSSNFIEELTQHPDASVAAAAKEQLQNR